MIDENAIRARYAAIKDQLDERGRRLFVAVEKTAAGYGGTAAVSRATGLGRSTIIAARRISLLCRRPRLASGAEAPAGRFRARRTRRCLTISTGWWSRIHRIREVVP